MQVEVKLKRQVLGRSWISDLPRLSGRMRARVPSVTRIKLSFSGMTSGGHKDFFGMISLARLQTPPSEIMSVHDFVHFCTISCRPSFSEADIL